MTDEVCGDVTESNITDGNLSDSGKKALILFPNFTIVLTKAVQT
jgi:hypothetical protein